MKKLILSFLPIFILSSQVFAIAGFGLNLNQSQFSVDAKTTSLGDFGSYGYGEFSGGIGGGGYLYIDAVPFFDLDLEFSLFRTNYDYLLKIGYRYDSSLVYTNVHDVYKGPKVKSDIFYFD